MIEERKDAPRWLTAVAAGELFVLAGLAAWTGHVKLTVGAWLFGMVYVWVWAVYPRVMGHR